jgi:hypothetical protein
MIHWRAEPFDSSECGKDGKDSVDINDVDCQECLVLHRVIIEYADEIEP